MQEPLRELSWIPKGALGRGYDPMRERILDQLCRGTKIELFHDLRLVKLNGSGRNLEANRNILYRSALSQQLQYFTLTERQCFFLL